MGWGGGAGAAKRNFSSCELVQEVNEAKRTTVAESVERDCGTGTNDPTTGEGEGGAGTSTA